VCCAEQSSASSASSAVSLMSVGESNRKDAGDAEEQRDGELWGGPPKAAPRLMVWFLLIRRARCACERARSLLGAARMIAYR
jgi:hypothetical protein